MSPSGLLSLQQNSGSTTVILGALKHQVCGDELEKTLNVSFLQHGLSRVVLTHPTCCKDAKIQPVSICFLVLIGGISELAFLQQQRPSKRLKTAARNCFILRNTPLEDPQL